MSVETDEVGHILVVDDDVMVRQTITNYLEQQSVPAASVSSRQDLSRHLEKAHPSLILLSLGIAQAASGTAHRARLAAAVQNSSEIYSPWPVPNCIA